MTNFAAHFCRFLLLMNNASFRSWWVGPLLVVFAVLGQLFPVQAAGRGEWQLQTNKDGIQVYVRAQPGSRFQEVKVECEMPGTLAQFVALYSDVANYHNVIRNTRRAYMLRAVSEKEFFYYLETQLPALVANRDLVMRLQFAYTPATHYLQIHTSSVNGLVPVQAGIVRVPYFRGEWQVWALSATRLKITYCFRVDPGGALPAWLVNRLAPVAPYQSLLQLRRSLALPRYQGRHFAFLAPTSA
jgi:hypothetical protein